MGTDAVDGLAAAATSDQSISLTAPSSAGTYHYGACVDAVAGEANTTNNCSGSVTVTVSETPTATSPDLTVSSSSVDDDSPTAGASFTLSATVENAGNGSAAETTLRYYRSADATIAPSDAEVGTASVGALPAGATSRGSIGLSAPAAAGTYHYGACVDPVDGESDTTNNCSGAVAVTVAELPPPPAGPDLEVQALSASDDDLETGEAFTLSATVRNAGGGSAPATTLRYYRSPDATIATSDTEVGAGSVGALPAGGTSRESIGLSAPAARTYYYGACVDPVAGESDPTNNCSGSVAVTVAAPPPPPPPPPRPDLEVQAPSASDDDLEDRRVVHLDGDGAQRRGRPRGGDDAALLPVGGPDDCSVRHRGGRGRHRGAVGRSDAKRVDPPDAAGRGHVLLRRVRGPGGGRVRHHEQLLGPGAGHRHGAATPAARP